MSPYRRSADIAGTSQTEQLHGWTRRHLLHHSIHISGSKLASGPSSLIVQGAAPGSNRAYTGQLASMARLLYRALPQPHQQVLDNAQAQGQVNYKRDDQVSAVEQIMASSEKSRPCL
jgi:hypothetical protein